ncbi:hypothetical protein DH2020_031039 [Rehmannia glutinosa]|uniref:Uncharacterized protein n=1 Tax=Rehmannia glutinosa TaxID=99300 RepID=A0ABR0VJB0_REHGL
MNKRPLEDPSTERPRKIPVVKVEDNLFEETKIFKFRLLLPNGTSLELKIRELRNEMPIEEFIDIVRKEYSTVVKKRSSADGKRRINWKYQDLHFTDAEDNKIRIKVNFRNFVHNKCPLLWLHDGLAEAETFEDMWDLTPDTDLLKELPDDYTFETALADLIDNSLQALWSNDKGEKRLISVEWHPDRISIFDSGPGMDGTEGNLVKWSARGQAIGGKPPYLTPFFGMFGYGGPVATMCLGRRAVVSSKTKNCNKVFTLHLEREALMNASRSENCWRTKGGMRDPSEDEKKNSPHGSFTKVEIFEPRMKTLDVKHLQCKLKDIYFPYIQCDEMSGKTSRPIEFRVNGKDLAGIQGGEVATTNLHSCNGRDFIVQLHFSISHSPSSMLGQSQRVFLEANARLKCVYFPIVEGEESFQRIIDKLDAAGCGFRESFESFSRVSVRRLGRLLPDTRWALLPFMEPKQKKGEKAQILKRCCSRVKCFIDTDSGFNPTPHKTDLAQHHPYTKALKNFGNRAPENEKEVQIKITRDGKELPLLQLEKQYADWLDSYWGNLGQYVIVKEIPWLRPIGLPEDKGCRLLVENGNQTIDIRDSLVLPIRIIDSEKCVPADDTEWENRLGAYRQKLPSVINLLSHINCQELEIEGGFLPSVVEAGDTPPENIVAVIRPNAYTSGNSSKSLDQKFIVKDNHEMILEVKFIAGNKNVGKKDHVHTVRTSPSSHKGLHGLYLFPVKLKHPQLFERAGFYTFSFFLNELKDVRFEQVVQVQASTKVGCWKVVSHNLDELYTIGVGSCFEPLSVACYDRYDNCIPFTSVPKLTIALSSSGTVLARVHSMKVGLRADKSIMTIKDIVIKSSELDDIRPDYEATLDISTLDKAFSVAFPCRVIPGIPQRITVHPPQFRGQLIPGQIIEEFALEVFDEYGNHAKVGENILLSVDGFSFQDGSGNVHSKGFNCVKKVNSSGCVDLSNILKVSKGYGKAVSLSVISQEKVIFKLKFQTEIRKLRSEPKDFKNCEAGSQLENIVFEIINYEGKVDESIHDEEKHGQSHTLTIKSNSFDIDDSVRYSFRHGRCTIRSIPLPQTEGNFSFSASHSRYPELNLDIEVHVKKAWQENRDFTLNHEDVGNSVSDPQDLGNLAGSALICEKDLEDDLAYCGSKLVDHHRNFEVLNASQSRIQQQISDLQASIDRDHLNVSSMCGQEWTREQIKSRSQSAAAVICKLHEEVPLESRPRDILGVVALLGTVQSIELSRILAQYLGEDLMCTIVCENYAAAYHLETNTLNKFATKFGQTIRGYVALCLDDIRPSTREPSRSSDPQKPLPLRKPTLPEGDVPRGFLGYAVNMISIEESYLRWRTKSDGAVSLDGGIMRGNGLVSFGHWEPDIIFPVKNRALNPQSAQTLKLLEARKLELMEINRHIDVENESYKRDHEKFIKSRDRYNSYCLSQNRPSPAAAAAAKKLTTPD